MFSMHAFGALQTTSTAMTNIAAAADPVASVSGNFFYIPALSALIGVYGLGATLARVQLQSPSLLAIQPYDVAPVDTNALPATPLPINMFPEDPFVLKTDEPLQALVTNTTQEREQIFFWLADKAITPVTGNIIRARATITTPSTGYAWGNAAMTLSNPLAEGNYQLVGCRAEGAHLIAVRFVFPAGSATTRPGCIATGTATKLNSEKFRNGNLGVWGEFSNRVPPTVDMWNDGNTETATLILDLIKTS